MVDEVKRILKVFADNSLFEEGVELIGSWCFDLYQKHLGVKSFPLRTLDIDFLIPNPFRGKEHKDFAKQIEKLGFYPDFDTHGSLCLSSSNIKIEFITPLKGQGLEKSVKIKKFGFNAIPLRFVDILLKDPIVVADSGINIKVPNPVNFCLHKLIIASRRPKAEKRLKDLQQAICVSVVVDKKSLKETFNSFPGKWKSAISKMLNQAKDDLPLFSKEIEELRRTLQNN